MDLVTNNLSNLTISSEEHESCVICIADIQEKVKVEKCNHSFCYGCIIEWSKWQRSCPICKLNFVNLVKFRPNGSQYLEAVPEPTRKKEVDVASDLQALDHTYFGIETIRLLDNAQELQRGMAKKRAQRGGGKYNDVWENKSWDLLQDIVNDLRTYRELFGSDDQIEPGQILQDLYKMEESLREIQRGPHDVSKKGHVESTTRYLYSADDDYQSDESDDDYEEYYEPKKHNTKTKPRTPNNKKEHTSIINSKVFKNSPKRY